MTSFTLVKCNSMIISIVMPSYPNVTFVSLLHQRTLNYCSYSKYDNQPQNSLNQITLNIIQKIMQVICQFTSFLTDHFDQLYFSGYYFVLEFKFGTEVSNSSRTKRETCPHNPLISPSLIWQVSPVNLSQQTQRKPLQVNPA